MAPVALIPGAPTLWIVLKRRFSRSGSTSLEDPDRRLMVLERERLNYPNDDNSLPGTGCLSNENVSI